MSTQPAILNVDEVTTALQSLPDWRRRLGGLHTVYHALSSVDAVELMYRIGQVANELDHHPDLDWRYDHVFVRTSTHSAGSKITAKDIELATRISTLAAHIGASAEPEKFRTVEIGVDTTDPEAITQTWSEALGYRNKDGELRDPWGRGPSVWFQKTPTPDASRLHLDIWVEDATADDVLVEAEKAGASRLDERFHPTFTVIADDDGNRFCICTALGRSH